MNPRVTVVMTARERHGLTERAIDSVFRHTPLPYRFLYLDVQSPPWLRELLARRAAEWHLQIVRFDEPLWPQQARIEVAADFTSEYVVFIDNDVEVSSGWLQAMLNCADETGAGIVGPLYLWGDGATPPKVHMAGGKMVDRIDPDGRVIEESHEGMNADPDDPSLDLQRRACGFVEFHCMLIRTDLLDQGRLLDPDIACVHEHIDVALGARERGFEVMFEPAARVTYLAFAPYSLDELSLLRRRWAPAAGEASIAAFCRKWRVVDDERSFWGVRTFLQRHVAGIDPIRPDSLHIESASLPMTRSELCQSRADLLDLAQAVGYQPDELNTLIDSVARAQLFANAGYRPCGRPFLNHLIGTAGVLVRYGFRVDIVAAALLHAAYTHCPPMQGGARAAVTQVEGLLAGKGSRIERRVRAYTQRERTGASLVVNASASANSVFDAEILMIVAANEIDMHLSGEVRYTGRSDVMSAAQIGDVVEVCAVLGVPGLAETLKAVIAAHTSPPVELRSGMQISYRLGGRVPGPISMISDAPSALDA